MENVSGALPAGDATSAPNSQSLHHFLSLKAKQTYSGRLITVTTAALSPACRLLLQSATLQMWKQMKAVRINDVFDLFSGFWRDVAEGRVCCESWKLKDSEVCKEHLNAC